MLRSFAGPERYYWYYVVSSGTKWYSDLDLESESESELELEEGSGGGGGGGGGPWPFMLRTLN